MRVIIAILCGLFTALAIRKIAIDYNWPLVLTAYVSGALAFVMGAFLLCNPDQKKERNYPE